jgi:hypothetical protein
MAREINEEQPYRDKLLKLIPTEIVGAYMVLSGMLGYGAASTGATSTFTAAPPVSDSDLKKVLIQAVFIVLLVLTPIYLRVISKVKNLAQIVASTISFVVWVYTLGGPFVVWQVYYAIVGSVILVLWSLIAPLFVSAKPEGP